MEKSRMTLKFLVGGIEWMGVSLTDIGNYLKEIEKDTQQRPKEI